MEYTQIGGVSGVTNSKTSDPHSQVRTEQSPYLRQTRGENQLPSNRSGKTIVDILSQIV